MADNKFNKIDGILYAKPVKSGKRKDGGDYSVPQIVLEIDSSYNNAEGNRITNKYLMIFDLSKATKETLDLYDISDPITVSFVMKGREYPKKDGTKGYDNAMLVTKIEHSSIDSGNFKSKPITKETYKQPIPPAPIPVEDDEVLDLPF